MAESQGVAYSHGRYVPIEQATIRCASLVWLLAWTAKTISPGVSISRPRAGVIRRHPGGKMLDTVTILNASMPASRSANS